MQSNPGAADPAIFEHEGVVPVANLVIAYRCTLDGDTYDLVSAAERFQDAQTAAAWADGRITCGDDVEWRDGAVVAAIEDMDGRTRAFRDDVAPAVANIEARTGAERICA